jgi:very-short-patch-repair endonuclease
MTEFDLMLERAAASEVRIRRERFQFLVDFYRGVTPRAMELPAYEWAVDINCVDWRQMFSPIEAALRSDIRDEGAVLYPQYPIGPYFADFANPKAGVVVECDGAAFHMDKARDEKRDKFMHDRGFVVIRMTGSECMSGLREYDDPETGHPRVELGFARWFVRHIAEEFRIARRYR